LAEYVIIGGGVYGAGVAYWLSQAGAGVRLLEAKKIGNGASAGPGRRGTRANGRDLRELPIVRMAHEMWPELHQRLGVPQFFERTGHLLLIEREQDVAVANARARLQNQMGTATHVLDAAEVHELEPGLSRHVIGALHCPADGATDHSAVTQAFAGAARTAGAEISENTVAERFEMEAGRVSAVITSSGERIAVGKRLFVMANAGADGLIGDRVRLPIWSRTYQILITKPFPAIQLRHLIGHASRTLAIKSEVGDRIMISGGQPGRWDAQAERGTALDQSIKANLADAALVFPALASAEIELADADHLESSAIDNIPVIDLVPGTDNALYSVGWCGHGWAIAPPLVKMFADWGLTGNKSALLAPFSHDRFHV